ncbi:MAG: ABC transporter permease subunit [Kiritimatiellae bacterium]|nr:ABC transporter permease subunit [Kiritimatiellia bacterium]
MVFDAALAAAREPPLWQACAPAQRDELLAAVREAFERPVQPLRLAIGGAAYRVSVEKIRVRWPFRPVRGHPLGVDNAGRDVLARVLYGLRTSMTFALLTVVLSMALGTVIGAVQGYFAGWLDLTAQRLIEIWSAMPYLYLIILLGSVYGRSFLLLLIVNVIFSWIGISYYMRGEFLRLRRRAFVEAAKCMGVPFHRIIFRHILPNALVPLITLFPFQLVGAIGGLAALDYLGFGLPPPTPSWGELFAQAQQVRWAWWLVANPFVALFTVILLGVFVGEGVRNAFDPRRYSRMN